jgi:hypothetical protein
MQTAQGNMLQSLRTVQAFLEENAAKLTSVVNSGARARLDAAIVELATHVTDQSGNHLASQGATKKQRALREALLRDHMGPVSRIARSDLPQTPEIEPLRMPRGKPTAERLAAAAYGMAKTATDHAPVFVAAGLPADFAAQLTGAADALVSSLSERSQSRGRRSGATKGLAKRLTDGRRIVHVLDAFVKSALKNDAPLLANWNKVKRVQRVGVRPTTLATPAPTIPPAHTPTAGSAG